MALAVDYAITKVRYAKERRHIEAVIQRKMTGNNMGPEELVPKSTVVRNLKANMVYYTVIQKSDGSYSWGDRVITYDLNGVDYIRTDGNKVEEDNLGELPEF